jgi:hypothetical protein
MSVANFSAEALASGAFQAAWPGLTLCSAAHVLLVRRCLRSRRRPPRSATATTAAAGVALALWFQTSFAHTAVEVEWWVFRAQLPWFATAIAILGLLALPGPRCSERAIVLITTVAGLAASLGVAIRLWVVPLPKAAVHIPMVAIVGLLGIVSGVMGFLIVSPAGLSVARWGRQAGHGR